jgi:hypothetical protein
MIEMAVATRWKSMRVTHTSNNNVESEQIECQPKQRQTPSIFFDRNVLESSGLRPMRGMDRQQLLDHVIV